MNEQTKLDTSGVILCRCTHTQNLPDNLSAIAREALANAPVWTVDDLCGRAARRDPRLIEATRVRRLLILACYPRAVINLLQFASIDTDGIDLTIVNLRAATANEVRESIHAFRVSTGQSAGCVTDAEEDWIPWFPVIDTARCTRCRQCLNFCPFGVYTADEDGRVCVSHPDHCKTNCPACAHLCPELAIMFPKIKEAPINGAAVTEKHIRQCRLAQVEKQLDTDSDLHNILARRRARAAARRQKHNPT